MSDITFTYSTDPGDDITFEIATPSGGGGGAPSGPAGGDLAGTYPNPTVPGLAGKADTSSLATVATSGAYPDLSGKPTIPSTAADVGAVPTARTVNGHALSGDVTLTASDVGAAAIAELNYPPQVWAGASGGLQPTVIGNIIWRSHRALVFPDGASTTSTTVWGWIGALPWTSVDIYVDWLNRNASAGGVHWQITFGAEAFGVSNSRTSYTATGTAVAATGSGLTYGERYRTLIAPAVAVSLSDFHSAAVTRVGDNAADTLAGNADFMSLSIRKAGT